MMVETTNNKPGKKTKVLLITLVVLLAMVAIAGGVAYTYYQSLLEPVDNQAHDEIVIIPHGSSTIRIAKLLTEQGLIKDENAFRIYSRLSSQDGQMKAGEYVLSASMSTPEIVAKIVKGTVVTHPFTIPEGYTLEQIAKSWGDRGLVDEQVFLELLEEGRFDFPYTDQLLEGPKRFEGFLFPDTYYITNYMTERDIIQMMLNRFTQVVTPQVAQQAQDQGLSVFKLVTIAAMVERESSKAVDRPKVAGVIFNRINIGMPLQIDATVQYALPEHKSRLLYVDLEIDSPYNTYKYPGLPLGPIAAPGEKSIQAVLEPAEHDYYYYVLKPDGTHHFSRTLTEHNRAKNKYLNR